MAPLAILAGAALLLWPAFLNGYPLLFSDSGAFLHQTLGPLMIWDKPWIYGPFLHLFHWRITLWGPVLAQGVILSWLLWLVQRALRGRATPAAHLGLAAGLALATTAPFSAALLMPDIFAPVVVLCLFLLGCGRGALSTAEAAAVGIIGAVAIASHLSHLPLAAALVLLIGVLTWRLRPLLRAALPLLAAVLLLLGTNWVGHGRPALSPHGATFLLARLIADGPAARTIAAACPERGWYLCAWAGRLPADSDEFLWSPDSPVNRDAEGRPRFLGGALLSAEAREILAETLRREPLAVALAMLRNAGRQLLLVAAGDTLPPEHFAAAVEPRIREGFPAREASVFAAGLQARGLLAQAVAPILPVAPWVVLAAAVLSPWVLWRTLAAGRRQAAAFLLMVLVALAANALATGGLSKPHLRYQARIAWLLPFAVGLLLLPPARAGREEAWARG